MDSLISHFGSKFSDSVLIQTNELKIQAGFYRDSRLSFRSLVMHGSFRFSFQKLEPVKFKIIFGLFSNNRQSGEIKILRFHERLRHPFFLLANKTDDCSVPAFNSSL